MSVLKNMVTGSREFSPETLSFRWGFWAGLFLGGSAGSQTESAWIGICVGLGIFAFISAIFGAVREAILSAREITGE